MSGSSSSGAGTSSSSTSAAVGQFLRALALGSTGDDVSSLQTFLARDPSVYPEGRVTGYYGRLTETAVKNFQEKYGIASSGIPGYGRVGPKTRAKLNEMIAQ